MLITNSHILRCRTTSKTQKQIRIGHYQQGPHPTWKTSIHVQQQLNIQTNNQTFRQTTKHPDKQPIQIKSKSELGTTEPPTRSARGPRPTCGRTRAGTQERKLLEQLVRIAHLAQIHLLAQIAQLVQIAQLIQLHCQHNLIWLFSLYSRACTTLYCLHCLHSFHGLPPAHLVVLKSALIITGAQFTRHKKTEAQKGNARSSSCGYGEWSILSNPA